MAIGIVNNESSVGLMVEATEGIFLPPAATTDYIEVLADGTEVNKTREELSRDTLSSTVETEATRVGMAEVAATLPVEFGASSTAGLAPQRLDKLMRATLGGKRTNTAETTTTGATSTVLTFTSHGILKGDIVLVKEAGAYELRPVSAVDATTITLAFALENGAPSDGVEVEALTTYYSDTGNAPSLSMEHNIGNEIQQRADGLKVSSFSLENWTTGQIPTASFSLMGLDLIRVDAAQTFAPDFTLDALPPVALEACLYINGTKLPYSELGMGIENTITTMPSACSVSGKIGTRVTNQKTTFTCKKYMDDSTLTEWDNFENNDDASVFFFAFNPTSTAGEFGECVAVWLPQGKITAAPVGDIEGIASDDLAISCHKSAGNDSVFISMI